MEPPPPPTNRQSSPLLTALLSGDLALVREIAKQGVAGLHVPDQTGLTPALAALYLFHGARVCLGLHVPPNRPALIAERPGEGRSPLDVPAVTKQFGYTPIDSLEFESIDLLRKTLGARKLHILQRVVQSGDLRETPWLADQVELSRKFSALIDQGAHADVYIARVSDEVGWGVFAAQAIPSGSYVGEYVGVVRRAQPLGGEYAASYADLLPYCKLSVDAKSKGNWTRFVNHSSKRPNIGWRDVYASGVCHVVFVAERPIAPGEQLLVDYGTTYWATAGAAPAEL